MSQSIGRAISQPPRLQVHLFQSRLLSDVAARDLNLALGRTSATPSSFCILVRVDMVAWPLETLIILGASQKHPVYMSSMQSETWPALENL